MLKMLCMETSQEVRTSSDVAIGPYCLHGNPTGLGLLAEGMAALYVGTVGHGDFTASYGWWSIIRTS